MFPYVDVIFVSFIQVIVLTELVILVSQGAIIFHIFVETHIVT